MRQPVPFGKYLLLDRISVGGMAEVFKAKSYGVEGFEKIIAIKRILPTMGEDRDFIKMFIDEAKIAGQLAHANICQIFELGRIDGSHFIAMEYIWGKDLLQIQNRLRKSKQPMPVAMSCFCIAKVLEGLDYAHRKRDPLGRPLEIVHRDCSPQNVLVSYEGEVKVIDFGIAKATSRNSRTMAGVLKGKFGYMSPEQVRGLPLDRRSDIFAIGTMLYECVTGERLFQGETDFSTLEKVRNVDIQSPRTINPAIPEQIEKIILKALAKDVDDRYQWCSEMLADLQQFLMAQDVVFTAKSLSSWLKEIFIADIDRERGLLEQYKRVGRDGLIQGAPAAEAKLDVVEHLGEAGKPEGDATMLGGPNFDDMEHGVGATPDVNQSPVGGPRSSVNAPIGRKTPQPAPAAAKPAPSFSKQKQRRHDDEDEPGEGDFGEEAPTEIFGEDPPTEIPVNTPAAQSRPNPMAPVGKRPTPAGRPATERPGAPSPAPNMAPMAAAAPAPYTAPTANPYPTNQAYGGQPLHGGPIGTPPGQAAMGMPPQQEGPQRTVLGMTAPQLPNYANYRPSQQQPAMNPNVANQQPYQGGYPQQQPQPQQGYGGYQQQPNYTPPGQYSGYPGSGPMPQMGSATPVDHMGNPLNPNMTGGMAMPGAEGKKSTLARDIAIGVGIAALVLVGFLVVKMVVLDKGDGAAKDTAATSKLANVKIKMPTGMTAEMTVDGARVATVENGKEIAVSAGMKHIKLVGNNGLSCDDERVKLESGKTTLLECGFGGGAAASGSGAGSGSSASVGTGSAAVGTGSAAVTETKAQGSAAVAVATGSGAGSATTVAKTETKPIETKTETKPVETKTETKTTGTGTGSASTTKTGTQTVKTDTKTGTNPTTTATKTDTKATGTGTGSASTTKTDTKTGTQTVKTDTKTTGTGTKTDAKTDPTKGYLQVYSKPPAKILVDGQETNLKTPISGHALPLAAGKHKITFVIGDDRFTYPVMVKAGSTETMSKDLQ